MSIPNSDLPRVVVIGAGFAGLKLSRKLNTSRYQLVLIDRNNYHTFQPLMYQVASAGLEPDSIAYPVRKTLSRKKNTYFRYTNVNALDREGKKILTDIGEIKYDHLVIATGAGNNFFGNESIAEQSLPMKSLTEALNLRSKILENFEQALNTNDLARREELMSFLIVGGGPTGVELAGALAELKNKILPKDFPDLDLRRMRISIVEAAPRVLAAMSEESSEKAYKYLKKLGIEVYTNTRVLEYKNNIAVTDKDVEIRTDTLIWAAGVAAQHPDGFTAEELQRGNRIKVNQYCQVESDENIYVLGDAGYFEDKDYPNGLPMLGSVAMQQGSYLAKQLNKKAAGSALQPFKYKNKGTMATIGRNLAVVDLKRTKIQGAMAWMIWMFVHLMLLVGFRNRVVVFINWTWNYFRYNNGLRLIIRPYKRNNSGQ
ncbi:MAG: NAD(P)/FAD-dependent oxidoreductase [Crocinitomicaceae bacterium]